MVWRKQDCKTAVIGNNDVRNSNSGSISVFRAEQDAAPIQQTSSGYKFNCLVLDDQNLPAKTSASNGMLGKDMADCCTGDPRAEIILSSSENKRQQCSVAAPYGWCRFPLSLSRHVQKLCARWPIAYHGTIPQAICGILRNGALRAPDHKLIQSRQCHTKTNYYFTTPSLKYASFVAYATPFSRKEIAIAATSALEGSDGRAAYTFPCRFDAVHSTLNEQATDRRVPSSLSLPVPYNPTPLRTTECSMLHNRVSTGSREPASRSEAQSMSQSDGPQPSLPVVSSYGTRVGCIGQHLTPGGNSEDNAGDIHNTPGKPKKLAELDASKTETFLNDMLDNDNEGQPTGDCWQVVVEVRQHPKSYSYHPQTLLKGHYVIDPNYYNHELAWKSNTPGTNVVTALLLRRVPCKPKNEDPAASIPGVPSNKQAHHLLWWQPWNGAPPIILGSSSQKMVRTFGRCGCSLCNVKSLWRRFSF
eukprot:GHVT01096676.1.p1 GENE.GHVT01096676.1~~GHVT01096676.1.p1  ORF type:complete len:473 (+),score=19.86 GHVT01096676.1:3670-5088(+)